MTWLCAPHETSASQHAGGLLRLTAFEVLEEALITFVDTLQDVLDSLRAQGRPPAIFGQLLELGNMGLQLIERKMCFVHSIVASMQGDAMVMDDPTNMNLLVESSIPLCAV